MLGIEYLPLVNKLRNKYTIILCIVYLFYTFFWVSLCLFKNKEGMISFVLLNKYRKLGNQAQDPSLNIIPVAPIVYVPFHEFQLNILEFWAYNKDQTSTLVLLDGVRRCIPVLLAISTCDLNESFEYDKKKYCWENSNFFLNVSLICNH